MILNSENNLTNVNNKEVFISYKQKVIEIITLINVLVYWTLSIIIELLDICGFIRMDSENIKLFVLIFKVVVLVPLIFIGLKKMNWIMYVFIISIITLLLISCINNENIPYVILIVKSNLFATVPLVIIHLAGDSSERLLKYMRISSYIVLIYTLIIPWTSHYIKNVDYMTLSYGTIVCWAVITYFCFQEKKIIDILLVVVTSINYAIFGSRGVILCMGAYIIFCMLVFIKQKTRFKLIVINSILLIIIYGKFKDIMYFLISFLNKFGISSYTLSRIIDDTFTSSVSRNVIYNNILKKIYENPFFGYGIGYDRVIGGDASTYAHNMFLELWVDFGVIFGSIIASLIIIMFFYMIFLCKDKKTKTLFSIYAIPGFIILQLSSSIYNCYFITISFFIFALYSYSNNILHKRPI